MNDSIAAESGFFQGFIIDKITCENMNLLQIKVNILHAAHNDADLFVAFEQLHNHMMTKQTIGSCY